MKEKTFNDMVAEENLDELLEATRKLCNYKLQVNNIKLPTYIENEDVMQEVAIKVYQAYKKFDPSKASANTYFTRIIERVIIDFIRHRKHQLACQDSSSAMDKFGYNLIELLSGNINVYNNERESTNRAPTFNRLVDSVIKDNYTNENLFTEVLIDLKNMLTERELKIFKLRYVGYTLEEIAEKLKVSRPTVAKDWLRVRKVLMELL